MRGIKNRKAGQAFCDGWVIGYDFFELHEALDGKMPAEVVGMDVPLASPRVPCHTVYGTPRTSAYECVLLAAVGVLN